MTLAQRLAEAETAYHQLVTGGQPRVLVDQGGESITYTAASADRLSAYIEDLKRQIAGKESVKTTRFKTTKG